MIPVNPPLRTRHQARAYLKSLGMGVAGWARAHGLAPSVVHDLLRGSSVGARGQAHDAAVLLGMKVGHVGPVPIGPQAGPADKRRRVVPAGAAAAQGAQA